MDDQNLIPDSSAKAREDAEKTGPYRVLARKYRPTTFAELIGQEALVQTLTNAIQSGRLAHAFLLTGVRGVGKTTTARLIARALNCVGPDGSGGATIDPCGVCEHCRAIAEDRHMDVIEMDAASRTGVDDIRELIEGVRYRPTSARTKIYIIDEVHMLSKSAFNALLKTLEEPPEHVKFVFATTEIGKVPVTVLSRCQRFDLRRVDMETLSTHFGQIADAEGARIAPAALHLVARAADGSVRDGLSLLDQAIAHCEGEIGEDQVRGMLGLADRTQTFELLDFVLRGDAKAALELLDRQYIAGADPAVVLEDMLELVHWLTRVRIVPTAAEDPGVPEAERVRGREIAAGLSMPVLTRAWQMLLKGLGEARLAPSPRQAAEMVLVRLAHAAELPTPAEALARLAPGESRPVETNAEPARPSTPPRANRAQPESTESRTPESGPAIPAAASAPAVKEERPAPPEEETSADEVPPGPTSFREVVDLVLERKEMILHTNLTANLHLIDFEAGRIVFRPADHAPTDLAHQLSRFLNEVTSRRWTVTVSNETGDPTLKQQAEAEAAARLSEAQRHPLIQEVMETFPGAKVETVRPAAALAEDATEEPDETPETD